MVNEHWDAQYYNPQDKNPSGSAARQVLPSLARTTTRGFRSDGRILPGTTGGGIPSLSLQHCLMAIASKHYCILLYEGNLLAIV